MILRVFTAVAAPLSVALLLQACSGTPPDCEAAVRLFREANSSFAQAPAEEAVRLARKHRDDKSEACQLANVYAKDAELAAATPVQIETPGPLRPVETQQPMMTPRVYSWASGVVATPTAVSSYPVVRATPPPVPVETVDYARDYQRRLQREAEERQQVAERAAQAKRELASCREQCVRGFNCGPGNRTIQCQQDVESCWSRCAANGR